MPDAVARFSGFAAEYDAARPKPPAALVQVILQWAGTATPDVVDLGAGTGLSTVIWAGHAGTVTAVEPSAEMRAFASRARPDCAARSGGPPPPPAADLVVDVSDTSRRHVAARAR